MAATKSHLDIYIYKILASISGANTAKGAKQRNGMSGDGLKSMNNLVDAFDSLVISNVNRLMVKSGKKTVSANEIRLAIRLTVRGPLATEANAAGAAAVEKYTSTIQLRRAGAKGDGKLPPMSRSKMAGINFPVTRIENIMMERVTSERKSGTAAVFFAAASEYIATKILKLAAGVAESNKKVRITTRHLKVAYHEDEELARLFGNVVMSGGVVPADAEAVPAPAPKKKIVRKKAAPAKVEKAVKAAPKAAKAKAAPKAKAGKGKAKAVKGKAK